MSKKVVGIIRGGKEGNYEKSLDEGGKMISLIFENLPDEWKPVDILIDKGGTWYLGGLPTNPSSLISKVDVVWNTADPSYSRILEDLSIPNVGNNHFLKILESREMLQEHMKKIGVKMPRFLLIPAYQGDLDGGIEGFIVKKAKEVHEKFTSPWIIKTLNKNLNTGIHVAKTFPELIDAIYDCAKTGDSILVEESISGRNVSVHSVAGFRGQDLYHFPPIEEKNGNIISPGNFSMKEKEELMDTVKNIFNHINAKHYLKSDFILHPKHGIYLTHIELSPNLYDGSCFHESCESVGTKAHNVISHILEKTLK